MDRGKELIISFFRLIRRTSSSSRPNSRPPTRPSSRQSSRPSSRSTSPSRSPLNNNNKAASLSTSLPSSPRRVRNTGNTSVSSASPWTAVNSPRAISRLSRSASIAQAAPLAQKETFESTPPELEVEVFTPEASPVKRPISAKISRTHESSGGVATVRRPSSAGTVRTRLSTQETSPRRQHSSNWFSASFWGAFLNRSHSPLRETSPVNSPLVQRSKKTS